MISKLFADEAFTDRFVANPENAVDVIIPIIHTNELWESNLKSIYRHIPVKRLLISDGGCIDDSITILSRFPRVEIFDHKKFVSLGYCLRKLMEEVETSHFIYLHSDVYIPEGWFETMWKSGQEYDWCESKHINTFLLNITPDYSNYNRALSGGQIGRKASFKGLLPLIDDDYLYRNEDIIFSELIKQFGGKYGRSEAQLFHEIMNKKSQWTRTVKSMEMTVDKSPAEEVREFDMQARGLIKYLPPGDQTKASVMASIHRLIELDKIDMNEFRQWVLTTRYGKEWIKIIGSRRNRINAEIRILAKKVIAVFKQLIKLVKVIFA